ncbi:hypothetical protein ANANG_G00238670 [Anguilla anguilla]|uniref:DNAX-activation protein 10 n=1 Tax=Anguilla anguilla TaxID=7936 RepID=A0A9D3LWA3_ANGAN|nr:hypothetical protein ANANG_G00238670 [Anguilla anguilla]
MEALLPCGGGPTNYDECDCELLQELPLKGANRPGLLTESLDSLSAERRRSHRNLRSLSEGVPTSDITSCSQMCEHCYELDGGLLIGIIFVDLLVTGGVIIVIYNCAQRKSSSPAPASGRPVRANAPSVPDRDYEPLNHATRDTATYAVAGVNRTG